MEFASQLELYRKMIPVFNVKKRLASITKYKSIKNEDIWKYLVRTKWKYGHDLQLNDIVNDIKQNQVTKDKDINNNITNSSGGGSSNNTSNSINELQEETPQEDNNYNDFPDYNDVVTNDNQLVYNVNNECKLIVKHDGENVNGVEFYYDFHDKATADNMYNQVLEKYQDISGFDKIVQYEGYLKVLFNEEYYGGQTVEAFKEVYSQYYNLV